MGTIPAGDLYVTIEGIIKDKDAGTETPMKKRAFKVPEQMLDSIDRWVLGDALKFGLAGGQAVAIDRVTQMAALNYLLGPQAKQIGTVNLVVNGFKVTDDMLTRENVLVDGKYIAGDPAKKRSTIPFNYAVVLIGGQYES